MEPYMKEQGEVTRLLSGLGKGDQEADGKLDPKLYADLRRIAGGIMRGLRPGQTLQPTAVVHEAYLRMMRCGNLNPANRAHYLAVAALAMRSVLVDHARRKLAVKRCGEMRRVEFEDDLVLTPQQSEEVLALHEALERLQHFDPRQAKIVEMHYYSGASVDEIATALKLGERTVKRELRIARLFLKEQLETKALKP